MSEPSATPSSPRRPNYAALGPRRKIPRATHDPSSSPTPPPTTTTALATAPTPTPTPAPTPAPATTSTPSPTPTPAPTSTPTPTPTSTPTSTTRAVCWHSYRLSSTQAETAQWLRHAHVVWWLSASVKACPPVAAPPRAQTTRRQPPKLTPTCAPSSRPRRRARATSRRCDAPTTPRLPAPCAQPHPASSVSGQRSLSRTLPSRLFLVQRGLLHLDGGVLSFSSMTRGYLTKGASNC